MPVKKDEDGRRFVEADVEVPGSPEEVWNAIATGRGISSWFVPTTSDERAGGQVVSTFGPDMDSVGTIKEWNPPQSFVAETEEGPGHVATEWIVEARMDGTCVVRVVHRWFAETDEWDGEFEGAEYGWAATFFRMLRLYLTEFRGQNCSAFDLAAFSATSPAETWRVITSALQIDGTGRRAKSAPDAPALAGAIVSTKITDPNLLRIRETSPMIKASLEGMSGEDPELLLLLDSPAPGIAHMFVMPMGDRTMVSIRFYLYGDKGAAAAPDAKRAWHGWVAARFPDEATA